MTESGGFQRVCEVLLRDLKKLKSFFYFVERYTISNNNPLKMSDVLSADESRRIDLKITTDDWRVFYVVKNPAFQPGWLKLGSTTRMLGKGGRLDTLYTTNVPLEFEIVVAIVCCEPGLVKKIEDALKIQYKQYKINKSIYGSREWFFGIPEEQLHATLQNIVLGSNGRIQWWTKDNDAAATVNDSIESVSTNEDSETTAATGISDISAVTSVEEDSAEEIRKYNKYDYSDSNFNSWDENKKRSFKSARRDKQGLSNPIFRSVASKQGLRTWAEWDVERMSFVLKENYEWITPEIRAVLKDCF